MLSWANILNPEVDNDTGSGYQPSGVTPVTPPRQTGNTRPENLPWTPRRIPLFGISTTPTAGLQVSPARPLCSTHYNVSVNRQTTVDILYEYPSGMHVEYPETSSSGRVGHLFTDLDPENWVSPVSMFAYSLGPPKGMIKHGSCDILLDELGKRIPCRVSHFTCMYSL